LPYHTIYDITGQALLPTTRSGKVAAGQKVNIRFSSFPDTEYGIVRGVVRSISLVPAQANGVSAYILRVELPDGLLTTYNKELPYLPKMEGQADIITENTSLLERFLLPLKKVWTEGVESRGVS
jgi:HlyD family secretion protein